MNVIYTRDIYDISDEGCGKYSIYKMGGQKKVAPIKIWLTLVIMDSDYQNVYESCDFVFTWYAVC